MAGGRGGEQRRHGSPAGRISSPSYRRSSSPSSRRHASPSSRRSPSPSSLEEVSSHAPTEEQTDPFDCRPGHHCVRCERYIGRWEANRREGSSSAARAPCQGIGGCSAPSSPTRTRSNSLVGEGDDGHNTSNNRSTGRATNHSSPLTPTSSVTVFPDGMEDDTWGGVNHESLVRCRHGKHPRRMFCRKGKHTGRRFLCCPLEDKSKRCRFLHWMEEEWPPRAQHVILTLWDMVDQFMEKAYRNQVDMMAERALKNETLEEKEALQVQKEDLELEKLELLRQKEVLQIEKEEVAMRWRFSQSCCCALQVIVRNELGEKKRIWMVVVCLVGALVGMLFGIVLKMK